MSKLFAILVVLLAASVAGLWVCAAGSDHRGAAIAAVAGAAFFIAGGMFANMPFWSKGREAEIEAARLNSGLLALAYAWGAASMFAVYLFSGLKWQHGWQYGLAMALVAAVVLAYNRGLAVPNGQLRSPSYLRAARVATAVQAIAAASGVLWLLYSGKLDTQKGDWVANDIFLAGGFTVAFLSDLALATRNRLMRVG